MPEEVAAHTTVEVDRSHDADRTLILNRIDGDSAFMVTDAPSGGMVLTGPTAEGSRQISIPKNMRIKIENLGDYPIGYDLV
jgi:hypothetical protein